MILNIILKSVVKKYREINLKEIDYENAKNILKQDKFAILIDVRSEQEYEEGHIEGSINIPFYELRKDLGKYVKDKEKTIILYCQSGQRSKQALKYMKEKGYKNLYHIKGGLDEI